MKLNITINGNQVYRVESEAELLSAVGDPERLSDAARGVGRADMSWAARAKVRSGNPKMEVSKHGAVIGAGNTTAADGTRYRLERPRGQRRHIVEATTLRREPAKLRGKANVKAAKRRRTYVDGVRVIQQTDVAVGTGA